MKKLLFILVLITAIFVTVIYAADTKTSALAELTAVADADIMYIVDAGTSKKITVVNLFDTIDTFAELNTIVADETLVSEEGTPTLDALWTFDLGLTITTGDPFTLGVIRWDNGSDLMNGEQIADDTIDDDSIDWSDVTFADFDFETNWKMWYSDGSGDVTELTLGANGTFLESNGAAAAPAFRAIADGDVPDGITINLATLATTVTITDDESSADNQEVVFTTDNTNLESDGDFHYNPSTGTVTATEFVGGGSGVTGLSVTYENIGDPGASGSISFDAAESATYTSSDDQWVGVTISNTQADNAGDTELLTLAFTDDGDTNSHYLIMSDAAGTQQLEFIQNGADVQITVTGDLKFIATGGDFDFADDTLTTTGTMAATTFSGALSGNSTTTTTASAGDAAVDFFGAGVDAVTDATTCTDIEGTGLSIGGTTLNWAAASTDLTDTAALLYETELDDFSELQSQIADKTLVNTADGATWSGTHDFGGANLEIPQASPAVPSVDGEIEFDFTDGSLVIQHGSAHTELGSPTDVVIGKLIRCWGGTIFEPDNINDVMTVKAINSIEFPHGVVITAIYLGVSENTSYTLTVQNFDDFDTINGGAPTIDAVVYTADTTGEIIDSAPTYDTIAAGQLIMISIPSTDVDWIHFEIYYYEPAG